MKNRIAEVQMHFLLQCKNNHYEDLSLMYHCTKKLDLKTAATSTSLLGLQVMERVAIWALMASTDVDAASQPPTSASRIRNIC